jgi:hypothetical protein
MVIAGDCATRPKFRKCNLLTAGLLTSAASAREEREAILDGVGFCAACNALRCHRGKTEDVRAEDESMASNNSFCWLWLKDIL